MALVERVQIFQATRQSLRHRICIINTPTQTTQGRQSQYRFTSSRVALPWHLQSPCHQARTSQKEGKVVDGNTILLSLQKTFWSSVSGIFELAESNRCKSVSTFAFALVPG